MLTKLFCHLLNGPAGQRGCNMSQLGRCLRPQGGAEQYGCIFAVSLDLVWTWIVWYMSAVRVVGDNRTFGLNLRIVP